MDEMIFTNLPHSTKKKVVNDALKHIAESFDSTTYVLNKPLDPYFREPKYKDAVIVCFPQRKFLVLNLDADSQGAFEDFLYELKDDLTFLYRSKEYDEVLGSFHRWYGDLFIEFKAADPNQIESYFEQATIEESDYVSKKKVELILSLLTASYNDVSGLSLEEPANLLDAIKSKIMVFDTDQSQFLFSDDPKKKRVVIQGMAGTGKTELLLHKMKNAYVGDRQSKICFTCFNKVLASKLRQRIPAFFNTMHVTEQIAWDERLFLMSSWGSAADKTSGLYAFISSSFGIPFFTWDELRDINSLWNFVLAKLKDKNEVKPLFDYLFVDEAQDFPDSFFDVCDMITKKKVIVGLDVFQDIFVHRTDFQALKPDVLLKKCYRTDPRTLIFAHALCLGSFDEHPIDYLSNDDLDVCGYKHKIEDNRLVLWREPLNRFFKSETNISPITMIPYAQGMDGAINKTLSLIDSLRKEFPNIAPGDICIAFLDRYIEAAMWMDRLGFKIENKFGWGVNSAVTTKEVLKDRVFITNRNNVKGLEFPFVILVTSTNIGQAALGLRNSIYMALTRSFLRSYLLVDKDESQETIRLYQPCISELEKDGRLSTRLLSTQEKQRIKRHLRIRIDKKKEGEEYLRSVFEKSGLPQEEWPDVVEYVEKHYSPDPDFSSYKNSVDNYIRFKVSENA